MSEVADSQPQLPESPSKESMTSPLEAESPASVITPDTTPEEAPAEEFEQLEVDYKTNCTKLFTLVEKKDWAKASERCISHPEEAATWVSRTDPKTGVLKWKQLPLHVSVMFKAPTSVIKEMIRAYPNGTQSRDDQGMIPLHLALRHSVQEQVVDILLNVYPESIHVQDGKGRTPIFLIKSPTSSSKDGSSSGKKYSLRSHMSNTIIDLMKKKKDLEEQIVEATANLHPETSEPEQVEDKVSSEELEKLENENSELKKTASLFQDELTLLLTELCSEDIDTTNFSPGSFMSMLRAEIEKKSAKNDVEVGDDSDTSAVMISSLKERMQDMQQKLHDAKRALQENETNDGVVSALEDQIEKLRGELRDVKLQKNDLEQNTTTLNRMLKSETAKREDVEKKLVLLKEESDFELSETREQFESRLATMKGELVDMQVRADTSNKNEVEMSSVINGLEQENKAQKDECESLSATVDSMKAMIEKSRSQVNENVAKIQSLEADNETLVLDYDKKLQEKDLLIADKNQEIKDLSTEIGWRSESHKLESEKYEGQLVEERQKVEDYKITVKELTELNDRLKESLDQFKQNMDIELEQMSEKLFCQEELQEQMEDYKNQIGNLNGIVGHLRDNSSELRELVATLEKSVEDEKAISRAERNMAERLQNELDELQNEFEESKAQVNLEREMLESSIFQQMKENEKDLNMALEEVEDRLLEESRKHQKARDLVEKLERDYTFAKAELEDVNEKLESEKSMYADTISSIEEVNREKVLELEKELRDSLNNRKTQSRENQMLVDNLNGELMDLKTKFRDYERKIKTFDDDAGQQSKKYNEMREEYELKMKMKENEFENMSADMKKLERTMRDLEYEKMELQTKMKRDGGSVVRENDMLQRKIARMNEKIEEYKEAINKLNSVVKEQMASSENLRELISDLEIELEEEKAKNTRQHLGSMRSRIRGVSTSAEDSVSELGDTFAGYSRRHQY